MSARPSQLSHPLNPKQVEDLDDQLETLFRELNELADIFGLATKKGDLLVRGETGFVRVAAPSQDDLVLTSRKSEPGGVVWAAPAGGDSNVGGARKYWFYGLAYGAL